jgi:hypothetical protein
LTETYQLFTARSQDSGNLEKPYISEYQTTSEKRSEIFMSPQPFRESVDLFVEIATCRFPGSSIGYASKWKAEFWSF